MPKYPDIKLLIDPAQPECMIGIQANFKMLIANMSEQDRAPVIFALANATDTIAAAEEFFTVKLLVDL